MHNIYTKCLCTITYCIYTKYQCIIRTVTESNTTHTKEKKEMANNELSSKVRELKELKTMAEELAAEITAIEDEIKAEMTARNTEEMIIDVYKIRWTKVISNRFDSTAFKKANADLYNLFTKAVETRRFTVA